MTKSVLQKILIRLVLLATGLVLSSHLWGQGWDAIYANQTEGIRLRQLNGSQSKDSLSVKTTSNSLIWNSWGIGQTSEKFLNTKSGYILICKRSLLISPTHWEKHGRQLLESVFQVALGK